MKIKYRVVEDPKYPTALFIESKKEHEDIWSTSVSVLNNPTVDYCLKEIQGLAQKAAREEWAKTGVARVLAEREYEI